MTKVTIKTLTPVHVGSGRKLIKNIDFVYFSNLHNKPLVVLDETKIYHNIVKDAHFEVWVNNIENPKQDLLPFLTKIKPNLKPEEIATRITHIQGSLDKTEMHEQMHTALNKPYIPGSSLKGAIRTALLSELIHKQPDFVQKGSKIKNNLNRFYDKLLIKHYFADNAEKDQQNKDFLRFLQVGDIAFERTEVVRVLTYNLRGEEWEQRNELAQWTECIPRGNTSTFRIQLWKDTILKHKKASVQEKIRAYTGKGHTVITDVPTFVKNINAHTKKLLESEKNFITKQYDDNLYDYQEQIKELLLDVNQCKPNECVLRVGKHTGFLFMTGGWQEKVLDKTVFSELKIDARPKGERYKNFPLPKTRRFLSDGTPIGFVKLTFEE